MISCAPTPSTLTNGPSRCSRTSPMRSRAGNLFGTHRIDQPGPSAATRSRYARTWRRHRLVPLAERATLLRRRILWIPEGSWPLRPGRREHDPGRRRVVLADFRHEAPRAVGALGHIEDCTAVRTLFTK